MSDPGPPDLPLIGGALALDFCNTLAWRDSERPAERLGDYDRFLGWCEHSGCVDPDGAEKLRARSRRRRAEAAAAYRHAVEVRECIGELFDPLARGEELSVERLDLLRQEYVAALSSARLRRGEGVELVWPRAGALDAPLAPIVHSAWELLLDGDRPPIGMCAGKGCGWLFLDTTRNHSRTWCSEDDCGRRERVRRHRAGRDSAARPGGRAIP